MNGPKLFVASMIEAGLSGEEAEVVSHVRFHKKAERRHGEIKMAKQGETAEILLYEEIGFDFWTGGGWTPQRLVDELESMKPFDKIQLRINSPGGNAFDGITIFNILRRQEASIAVEIEGIAASAASFIAQVADAGQLTISEAGSMMIHRGQGVAMGDTNVMLEMAGILEKLDNQIAGFYAGRSGIKAKKWLDAMTAETWYFGKEAIEAKLADKSTPSKRVAACADLSQFGYQHVPERLIVSAYTKPNEEGAAVLASRMGVKCGVEYVAGEWIGRKKLLDSLIQVRDSKFSILSTINRIPTARLADEIQGDLTKFWNAWHESRSALSSMPDEISKQNGHWKDLCCGRLNAVANSLVATKPHGKYPSDANALVRAIRQDGGINEIEGIKEMRALIYSLCEPDKLPELKITERLFETSCGG